MTYAAKAGTSSRYLTPLRWISSLRFATTRQASSAPYGPVNPIMAHWGFDDPSAFQGSPEKNREHFDKIFRQIANRIKIFTSLPLATLDRVAIKRELDTLGNSK